MTDKSTPIFGVWQSAETAPKDGTHVIVAVDAALRGSPIIGSAYFDPKAHDGTWWWAGSSAEDHYASCIEDGNDGPPRYWMPLPPPPEAANADSLIATAKRIAWAHWTYWNRVPASITDVDDLWRALGRYEREGYLAAARAVSGGPVADPYAGVLERNLLELTKAIFDAPTMAAGYAILADWAAQCGHGVPVALRDPKHQPDAALVEAHSSVLAEVAAERRRQVEAEGWTPGHDDHHKRGEMAGAAACYIMSGLNIQSATLAEDVRRMVGDLWPWAASWWKPKDRRRDLIRAMALLIAEIERLDRAAEKENGAHEQGKLRAEFDALDEKGAQPGQTEVNRS